MNNITLSREEKSRLVQFVLLLADIDMRLKREERQSQKAQLLKKIINLLGSRLLKHHESQL